MRLRPWRCRRAACKACHPSQLARKPKWQLCARPCELDRSMTRLCCFLPTAGPGLPVGLGQVPAGGRPQALLKRWLGDKAVVCHLKRLGA